LFLLAFLLSPRHGVVPRVWRVWEKKRRTRTENLLRTLYIMMEKRVQGSGVGVQEGGTKFGVSDVAAFRQESVGQVRALARGGRRRGWVEERGRDVLVLTEEGLGEARRVVRNHRLWELFLTQEAHLAADHVHADAEYIEHVLPKDVLRKLEEMLEGATVDPHGSPIPK
jgi:manganese/zinc/iron transport system permease protein